MSAARPEMPRGIEDRAADMWEPLLAIADAAGGNWPKRARKAATELVGAAKEAEPSLGVRLLADLKTVFDKRGEDKLATSVILADLIALPESPWGDLKGKPITDRALATRLRQYGIKSRDVFVAGKALKGYYRQDLHDAWLRYLSPSLPQKRDERETSMQSSNLADIALIADVQGGGEEKAPDDPGPIPDCLRRHPDRRCDHCGSELGTMNAWDCLGRSDGIWLHPQCEEAWHDSFKRGTR
jgi:hypothetical protein